MQTKFDSFLTSIDNKENTLLIEAIRSAFRCIFFESLPISDFGGINSYVPEIGNSNAQRSISNDSTYMQNKDNQYFQQTLSDDSLDKINKSQSGVSGGRVMTYPTSGRGSDSMQSPVTRKNLAVQNAN